MPGTKMNSDDETDSEPTSSTQITTRQPTRTSLTTTTTKPTITTTTPTTTTTLETTTPSREVIPAQSADNNTSAGVIVGVFIAGGVVVGVVLLLLYVARRRQLLFWKPRTSPQGDKHSSDKTHLHPHKSGENVENGGLENRGQENGGVENGPGLISREETYENCVRAVVSSASSHPPAAIYGNLTGHDSSFVPLYSNGAELLAMAGLQSTKPGNSGPAGETMTNATKNRAAAQAEVEYTNTEPAVQYTNTHAGVEYRNTQADAKKRHEEPDVEYRNTKVDVEHTDAEPEVEYRNVATPVEKSVMKDSGLTADKPKPGAQGKVLKPSQNAAIPSADSPEVEYTNVKAPNDQKTTGVTVGSRPRGNAGRVRSQQSSAEAKATPRCSAQEAEYTNFEAENSARSQLTMTPSVKVKPQRQDAKKAKTKNAGYKNVQTDADQIARPDQRGPSRTVLTMDVSAGGSVDKAGRKTPKQTKPAEPKLKDAEPKENEHTTAKQQKKKCDKAALVPGGISDTRDLNATTGVYRLLKTADQAPGEYSIVEVGNPTPRATNGGGPVYHVLEEPGFNRSPRQSPNQSPRQSPNPSPRNPPKTSPKPTPKSSTGRISESSNQPAQASADKAERLHVRPQQGEGQRAASDAYDLLTFDRKARAVSADELGGEGGSNQVYGHLTRGDPHTEDSYSRVDLDRKTEVIDGLYSHIN